MDTIKITEEADLPLQDGKGKFEIAIKRPDWFKEQHIRIRIEGGAKMSGTIGELKLPDDCQWFIELRYPASIIDSDDHILDIDVTDVRKIRLSLC